MIQSNKIGSNLLWTHKNVAFIWDFFNKVLNFFSSHNDRWKYVASSHGLRTPRDELVFTAQPKINSHSQIFRYDQSIFFPC